MSRRHVAVMFLILTLVSSSLGQAAEPAAPAKKPAAPPAPPTVAPAPPASPVRPPEQAPEVSDVKITGNIQGENIRFVLELTALLPKESHVIKLLSGDIALEKLEGIAGRHRVLYEPGTAAGPEGKPERDDTYSAWVEGRGPHKIKMTFACRPKKIQKDQWRECAFTVPLSDMRELQVTSDRSDLEIVFPNAMRVTRDVKENVLTTTAILGVGRGFSVQWKPQVQELAGKLVAAAEVNAIASVSAGALRLDTVIYYAISQGEAREFKIAIPKALRVTQVRGPSIQDWGIEANDDKQTLTVTLTQPQRQQYALQIQGEAPLAELPADVDVPAVEPLGTIRADGFLCVGTDSAIHLKIKEPTAGLTQIDASGFQLVALDSKSPRPLPKRSTFCYRYAATPYRLSLAASDIRPAFDATQQVVVGVRDDDIVVQADMELDVRDAPVREVVVSVPKGFTVAEVSGNAVVPNGHEVSATETGQSVRIPFREPVMGKTLVRVRLEIGGSPLDRDIAIRGLDVAGAKNERGHIVIAADQGIQVEVTKSDKLREIHTGSVPMRVARAQMAYRFREAGWSLDLRAKQNPPSIRCEMFHLVSVGDGITYTGTTATFFITGTPVDKLRFRVPKDVANVEFVGRDIQGQKEEGDEWTVTLRRRVIGYYTLLVTANQRYDPRGGPVVIGGIECPDAETQVGYIAVASTLNLKLEEKDLSGGNLLPIDLEELPANYRGMVNAPLLRAYKYVQTPSGMQLALQPYGVGSLLGVVIDQMELRTSISKEGEAVTTVTYNVKNAKEQFLRIEMPAGAKVWSVDVEEVEGGETKRRRVIASEEKKDNKSYLLVPLARHRDPNSPATIVVVYGEAGTNALGLGHKHTLVAPRPEEVTSTAAQWSVSIPKEFAFASVDSNMAGERPLAEQPGLGTVGRELAGFYKELGKTPPLGVVWFAGGAAVVALVLVGVFARRWLGATLAVLIAAGWLAFSASVAVPATQTLWPQLRAAHEPPELAFTQTINLSNAPLEVRAHVVPWWAAGLLTARTIGLAALSVALAVLAGLKPRRRRLLAALAVSGIVCAAAAVPVALVPVEIVLLWALTLVPLAVVAARWTLPSRRIVAPAAAALLLLLLPLGCAQQRLIEPAPGPAMDRADFELKAEKDSMEVTERLQFRTAGAADMPILWGPAALIAAAKDAAASKDTAASKDAGVEAVMTETGCTLRVKKAGSHDVTVKFLLPLEKAVPDRARRFALRVPRAVIASAQLIIPELNLDVAWPSAVTLEKKEEAKQTVIDAFLGPAEQVAFEWSPRARQTRFEKIVFFTNVLSRVDFRPGVVECTHAVHFQIAQGELGEVKIKMPEEMAVTAVDGNNIGAWRYDPQTRLVEVRLGTAAVGEYLLLLSTQVTQQKLPYTVAIGVPEIEGAAGQNGALGLYPASDVQVEVIESPPQMNTDDYARDVAALLGPQAAGARPPRYAYRYPATGVAVKADVKPVAPEVRSDENAAFSIADDQLVYNGILNIAITKAGRFSVDLRIPAGYDIETLSSPDVSHWDEEKVGDLSIVTVHFNRQLQHQPSQLPGTPLRITLSQSITNLPAEITVPRIEVVDALKHTGQLEVSSDPGVRLSIKERSGVSHVTADMDARKNALVFKLLRPDWKLVLTTEKIEPRLEVDFLHVANVSEGHVRAATTLKYTVHNAAVKVFRIQVPENLTGLEIEGSKIAKTHEVQPGVWQVELASKESNYAMTVKYESRFDKGMVVIRPVRDMDADVQRGHVVVRTYQKVEVRAHRADPALKLAEARNIPTVFGERDLSDAALCYFSSDAAAALELEASRHAAADVLPATISKVEITTVVSQEGHQISQANMSMQVGSMRLLRMLLPPGAQLWSLRVDDRPTVPSLDTSDKSKPVVLIPLGQTAAGAETKLDFIYVTPRADKVWTVARQKYEGPQFDLPLRNVRWTLYLPESLKYSRFRGTLEPDEDFIRQHKVVHYSPEQYKSSIAANTTENIKRAKRQLTEADQLDMEGRPDEAKQRLQDAYNRSFSDQTTNEDARVKLEKLQDRQTVVGLVTRRGSVRPRQGRGLLEPWGEDESVNLTADRAKQVESSLGLEEKESLGIIADRVRGQQEAAQNKNWALTIGLARRGRVIAFERTLQVEENVPMNVLFAAAVPIGQRKMIDYLWALGIAVLVFVLISLARRKERPAPAGPQPQAAQPPQPPEPEPGPSPDWGPDSGANP